MVELGKAACTKQAALFITMKEYGKAYELSKESARRFPDDEAFHYILAKAAFRLGKYEEAALEGRKAYNLSKTPADMLPAAVIASSAYYFLGEFRKGRELLDAMEKKMTSEELEELQFIFSLVLDDEKEAVRHVGKLMDINRKAAEKLISRFLGGK